MTGRNIITGAVALVAFGFVVWILLKTARSPVDDRRLLALAIAGGAALSVMVFAMAPWRRRK